MSFDSQNNLVISNAIKSFFAQEINEQFQDDFASLDYLKAYDFLELFQEKRSLISGVKITNEQFGFLHQLELHHYFQDPVAIYME